jgi:hypothetical protein
MDAEAGAPSPTWRMCRAVALLARVEMNMNGGLLL